MSRQKSRAITHGLKARCAVCNQEEHSSVEAMLNCYRKHQSGEQR